MTELLPGISIDDLKAYTHRVLARSNLKIAVVGDIDAETLKPLLDRVFGALPAKPELTPIENVTPQGLGRRIFVSLDVPQAVVDFGGPGIGRKDPDFMTAYVVNHILGGGSSDSRLYHEVREKRGLADRSPTAWAGLTIRRCSSAVPPRAPTAAARPST